ncbi:hypothetical protein ACN23B_09025 [Anabaena sp. FACHB-709]|uniref:Uncharacterized protein n=2 Tax=Nostocaceae TaxID=1162 RepID=A0A1Z4KET5_ANAVA|nr:MULTISPECIES: hypothetical protein [Nostocaceae]BAY67427.1 hypothetical protein NIES23_02000 [Trichormus variabilis NIES-23]HBW30911.1 hypothetical protein [Nostoc sp. UBA8866]MBD2173368.1 hypothetical protein [Anabaena cylindrica FACHB-318]MBD2265118.1 hypothetical protein [Anabaena sp. FACHB-709]MBD2274429.1 hypothetical protein [Nostoc sp. PCC 7120 = FACHB-418]
MINSQLQLDPPPQDFVSPLLELRDYYARLVEEYETLFTQARSQLDHVEALLSTWSPSAEKKEQISIGDISPDVSTSFPKKSLPSATNGISPTEVNLVESKEVESQNSGSLEIESFVNTDEDNNESPEPSSSPTIEITPETIKGTDIPMLPEYQSLTRMEAIKKLLEEHLGAVCHIDFIVRSLYGELESYIFRVVKGRVQSSLTQGRERQAWFGIPDEPGCYTLDLGLVSSNRTHTYSQNGRSKKKKPVIIPKTKVVPMLEPFEGQFLIDALSVFFKQHPGKVFSVAQVISGLYGELDEEDTREVKGKVLNELSRGYRTGRFARLPNKVGFYTLDLKLAAKSG